MITYSIAYYGGRHMKDQKRVARLQCRMRDGTRTVDFYEENEIEFYGSVFDMLFTGDAIAIHVSWHSRHWLDEQSARYTEYGG